MEAPECLEPDEEKVAEDDFKENDKNRSLKEVDGNNISIISRQSDNKGEDFAGQTIFNEICDKIMLEYLNGDWSKFFYVWDHFFISYVKGLIEYKILTLKLRVHFAILPIRIIQLHQNINFVPGNSSKVSIILRGAAEKFNSIDDEEDSEGEQNKLILQNMKQLEDYFNSHDGQKLTKELKDSSFMTFFALPYINNPHEDESVKNIFLIDWLEELSIDLEKFLVRYCQREYLLPEEELKTFNHNSYIDIKESKDSIPPFLCNTSFSNIKNEISSKLSKNDGDLIACNRIIHSVIKNKEIENWIAKHHSNEDNNSHTVSTQTRISSIKTGTGFSLISEPHHISSIVTPSIFAVSNKQSTLYNDELSITKLRLLNVHKHYRKLKLRFHKLHEDYQKMNEIAEELTIALENSVRGQPVNIDMILQTCTKIFPDRFNRDLQTDSESTSIDLKDLPKDIITTQRKENINSNPSAPKLLDYKKIKFNLKSANIKTKLLLLQALRQKLTLTKSNHRDEAVEEYAQNDILGLQGHILNNTEKHILSSILQPINSEVTISFLQQTTSRFLNAIASFSIGRTYLTTGPIVLNAIIKYLDNCNDGVVGDGITLDMLLATLQKMSLRKQQRDYMIEANLVEWLIYHLSNENFRMGPYRLEYSCALLMNLSLQSEARSRASVIAPLFVSTMTSLLSTDCISILPYVNGALQNFLLNYEINEEAKKLHLAEILEYHYVQTREDLKNHFSQTLKTHKREGAEYLSDDDEFPDEDDELFDVLEKELEENDPIKVEGEELQGENLLAAFYCVRDYYCKLKNISNSEAINDVTESYNNMLVKESKKAGFNGSTVIAVSETTFSDSKTETIEKKSGTGISKPSKKIGVPKKNEVLFQSKEEEEAFLAKPKLMRTPPSSARSEVNREEIAREIQEKTR